MASEEEERAELRRRLLELLAAPEASDGAIEDLYLRLAGPRAWAEGWRGYQEQGRGALVLDLRGKGWRAAGAIDGYYVPEALLFEPGTEPDAAIEVAVGVYRPADEVVVIVLYDHGPSVSRLRRSAAPPMA